jgi:PAS domain S-box-containing protein
MSFDVRTFAFILGLTHCMQVVVFVHQYKVNKTYPGVGWWLLWSATEAVGFVFILLRDIPGIHLPAVIFQNILLVLGTLFLYVGVMRFLDRKENMRILVPIFVLFAAAHGFFVFFKDDIVIRGVALSVALTAISFMTAWALYKNKLRSIRESANFNAAIFLIHGCVFMHRAGMLLTGTPFVDFYTRTLFNTIPYLDALLVSLLWTFGLIVMLNQRLNAEMTEVKEHFESIFNTGPDAAFISRLDDGVILNINDGFTAITGFTRIESIGRSTLDIPLWKSPDDRRQFVGVLREKGFYDNFESVYLRKDKTEFFGLTSAKTITLQGGPHIISVTRDITERIRSEERLKALLREKEILLKEIHHRVKNNFQIVGSLLTLQSENVEDAAVAGALMEGRNRVQTMSLIHEKTVPVKIACRHSVRRLHPGTGSGAFLVVRGRSLQNRLPCGREQRSARGGYSHTLRLDRQRACFQLLQVCVSRATQGDGTHRNRHAPGRNRKSDVKRVRRRHRPARRHGSQID